MAWFQAVIPARKSEPVSTHSKPSCGVYIQECPGQFKWAKLHPYSGKPEIRRECPVCGCRQRWVEKSRVWAGDDPNPQPGSHEKYLTNLVGWGP